MLNLRVILFFLRTSAMPLLAVAWLTAVPACGAQQPRVRLGVDVLLSDSLHVIQGKRVGLITNHTGRDAAGVSTIDRLAKAAGVRLTALYGPEHGLRGIAKPGEKVSSTVDSATGVPVYSLYGETRVPSAAMLKDVDVLIFDIQDVGARVYTYPWTMTLAAEAATKAGKTFVVLDRPNPIRADRVEGGILDPKFRSFVGAYPVAMRYGLTVGELARYLIRTKQLNAEVRVIPMQNYARSMWWDDTGIAWVSPSPNMRSVDAAVLYPGTVFFEGTNVTEGRGTDAPYQLIGAPWLTDAGAIARQLNDLKLPGVSFDSTTATPAAGYKWEGQAIPVVRVTVTDRNAVHATTVALHFLRAIYVRHPKEWEWRPSIDRLAGSDRLRAAVQRSGGIEALLPILERESAEFARASAADRLYR